MSPKVPALMVCTTSPNIPAMPHHSTAAMTIATAIRVKPTPSRRSSGSRSRALVPTRRAVPPATCATPIQVPRSARTGSDGPPPPRAGWRPLADAEVLRAAGREEVDFAAGREVDERPRELDFDAVFGAD